MKMRLMWNIIFSTATRLLIPLFTGGCSASPCSPGVVCRNIGLGGYKCEGCLPGFKNDTGGRCVDVNEVGS